MTASTKSAVMVILGSSHGGREELRGNIESRHSLQLSHHKMMSALRTREELGNVH